MGFSRTCLTVNYGQTISFVALTTYIYGRDVILTILTAKSYQLSSVRRSEIQLQRQINPGALLINPEAYVSRGLGHGSKGLGHGSKGLGHGSRGLGHSDTLRYRSIENQRENIIVGGTYYTSLLHKQAIYSSCGT